MGTRSGDLDPGILVYLMRELTVLPSQEDEQIARHTWTISLTS
jgi:acetate kinase